MAIRRIWTSMVELLRSVARRMSNDLIMSAAMGYCLDQLCWTWTEIVYQTGHI